MSREAMQMALDMLNEIADDVYCDQKIEGVITALRQALETEQEPVAWISDSPTKGNGKQLHWTKSEAWRWSSNITPLYTEPPKKEWVGLTDQEIGEVISGQFAERNYWVKITKALESKLKEKNT